MSPRLSSCAGLKKASGTPWRRSSRIHSVWIPAGGDIQRMFVTVIVRNVHAGFASDRPDCIVIQHGHRIIAASVVNSQDGVENHLSTGPCVLHEYRGRGLGTVLFRTSLAALREAGLSQAYGISREKSTASRFLYPRFGGEGSRWTPDFEVAQRIAA